MGTTNTPTTPSSTGKRWVEVSSNKYFKIFVDTRTMEAGGQAQDRYVEATLKFEYTPLGSQWLGNTSNGLVKPDIITYSFANYRFEVQKYSLMKKMPSNYYDVHGNLILKDVYLENIQYLKGGKANWWYAQYYYIPGSTMEQIKEKLFYAYGWDY